MKTDLVKLTAEWEMGIAHNSRGDDWKCQLLTFDPVFLYLIPSEDFS